MEICECHLSFLSIKEENRKATQSRYIVPLFQRTLKAWRKFAGATEPICTRGQRQT